MGLEEVGGQPTQQQQHMVPVVESSWVHGRRAVQKEAVEKALWDCVDCAAGNARDLYTLDGWRRTGVAQYLNCWDARLGGECALGSVEELRDDVQRRQGLQKAYEKGKGDALGYNEQD